MPGREFIPAGPAGSFDSHVCFAAHMPLKMPDGSSRIYYMGGNGKCRWAISRWLFHALRCMDSISLALRVVLASRTSFWGTQLELRVGNAAS